jgi:hypothetical protein
VAQSKGPEFKPQYHKKKKKKRMSFVNDMTGGLLSISANYWDDQGTLTGL